MECDEVPQDVQNTLTRELEDAKMVEITEDISSADKEECTLMDTSGGPEDEANNSVDKINSKDETDNVKEEDKSILESTPQAEKNNAQVYKVDTENTDSVDAKVKQIKEEIKSGSTPGRKEEFELSYEDEFIIPESISDREYATSEEMLNNCPWKLGQLAWARMSIYPFWPCIVSYEPTPMKTFAKVQAKGRSKTLMIHVHFFNDHGRHSWIPSHHMIPFNGIEEFRKRAKLVTDSIRKKEPKFAAALTIKPNLFPTWQKAVAEAMDVLYELDLSPLESFNIHEKKELSLSASVSASEEVEVKKKRKSKGDDDGKEVKKARKSISKKGSKSNSELPNDINLDTPPVSPNMTPAEYRKVYNKKQKRIRKMIDKLQPPDFEVFYDRNYDDVMRRYPESTDEHVRLYLQDAWNRMKDVDKLRYRSAYIVPRDADQRDLLR